jgi:PhnB protein
MNMSIQCGGVTIMASDNPSEMYSVPQGFRVQIAPASLAEFDRVHDALSRNARSVEMPATEAFWAERFAMFTDRFGTPWMINFFGNKSTQT